MSETQPAVRTRRPGRPRGLTVDRIVDAAANLISEEGLAGLSVPRLARVLGSPTATLYGYFDSRDDLIALLVERSFIELRFPGLRNDWRATLAAFTEAVREVLLRHPDLAEVMARRPVFPPTASAEVEKCLAVIVSQGCSLDVAARAYSCSLAFCLGYVQWERSRLGHVQGVREMDPPLDDSYPLLQSVVPRIVTQDADATFGIGIRALLQGLPG